MKAEHAAPAGPRPLEVALLVSVFVVAACGLVYELAAGALAVALALTAIGVRPRLREYR